MPPSTLAPRCHLAAASRTYTAAPPVLANVLQRIEAAKKIQFLPKILRDATLKILLYISDKANGIYARIIKGSADR
ncbi:hypothetical protein K439DRAFT_1631184 [Ramaria rubella]|nr:hypothetical protein K439DRAFT_1631184 [Ramaria rubella]